MSHINYRGVQLNTMGNIPPNQMLGGVPVAERQSRSEKDMFLELLVAQMRYQDPLNPIEGTDFTAQLAQFSSLEQLRNMSTSLDASMQADMLLARSINNTLATTIVGKSVKAVCDEVQYDGENPAVVNFDLSDRAADVTVEIIGADGRKLRTISESGLDAGSGSIQWDGCDNGGNKVPAGTYHVEISATSPEGNPVAVQPLLLGHVDSVRFIDGNPVMVVDGREIPFGSVLEIYETEADDDGDDGGNWFMQLIRLVGSE